jgi:hypothetical protein
VNEIFSITEKVFEDAEVGGSLLLQFTIKETINLDNEVYLATAETIKSFIDKNTLIENKMPQSFFLTLPNYEISVVSDSKQGVLNKLHKFKTIKDYYKLKNGLNPGNIKDILISQTKQTEKHKPIIWGKDISKYSITWSGEYVNYDEEIGSKVTIDDVQTKQGMNKQSKIDFALRTPDLFEQNKLVVRKTGDSLIAAFDAKHYYFDTLVHGIYQQSDEFPLGYLLAIVNSKPATLFYRQLHDIKGKVFAKISLDNLASFPLPNADNSIKQVLADKTILLADKNLDLDTIQSQFLELLLSKVALAKPSNKLQRWYELDFKEFVKELEKAKVKLSLGETADWMPFFTEQKKKAIDLKNEIDKTDKEIDRMVYELYELTEEEVKIVEGR